MSATFATDLLGWKKIEKSERPVPNSADTNSTPSKELARCILDALGLEKERVLPDTPKSLGPALELAVCRDLRNALQQSSPSHTWHIDHKKVVADFMQYRHLRKIARAVRENPALRADLGLDYLIRPDVTVGRTQASPQDAVPPFLHAAVSCKWTIRSDRVQNVRHEFLQMIRHRRGRLPHLVAVTAEPMPSRIAAIARGTGEVDAVYHIALDALKQAVEAVGSRQQQDDLAECIGQGRLLAYEDLAPTLANW
ncbi:NgoMIV family type II restriction endonuclease [Streptomyces sp. NPDC059900]|uniref:NgoMIV family type II restriction endonuclease n=1 Tax=Streptomyces sp. NPDC059900 TaxID=3155816 RepID=UPI00343651A9